MNHTGALEIVGCMASMGLSPAFLPAGGPGGYEGCVGVSVTKRVVSVTIAVGG